MRKVYCDLCGKECVEDYREGGRDIIICDGEILTVTLKERNENIDICNHCRATILNGATTAAKKIMEDLENEKDDTESTGDLSNIKCCECGEAKCILTYHTSDPTKLYCGTCYKMRENENA